MSAFLTEKEFDNITSYDIIQYNNSLQPNHYYSKKPIELFRNKYLYGQTIILQGEKSHYDGLIDFWLSCQAWYNSDGQDTFFKNLKFDDITSYTDWQNNINRVGQCETLNSENKLKFKSLIPKQVGKIKITNYLEMDCDWNNNKIIFSSKNIYYLYYFWTSE